MPHEDYCYALERENKTLNKKYDDCVRQLTEAHARIDRFELAPKGWWHKEVEDLKQQLADSQKCEVMLRVALERLVTERRAGLASLEGWDAAREALAATADLDGVILCHAEPVAEVKKHTGSLKDMAIIVWIGEQPAEGAKLYRAWGPK